MLRAIGIPARLVAGYGQGERLSENDEFLVKIKDNHSWVEAFFPGSGWITLEPTPSQPGVILEAQNISADDFGREEAFTLGNTDQERDPGLDFYFEVNEKYQIINQMNPPKATKKNKIVMMLLIASLLTSGTFFVAYMIFLRKRTIKFPGMVEKRFIQYGKEAPTWLKRWSDYEKLPGYQKAYKNLRLLSGVLLFREDKKMTPKEFIEELNNNFDVNEQAGTLFLEQYQQMTYGNVKNNQARDYFKNYQKLLKLIINSWKDKSFNKLKFR